MGNRNVLSNLIFEFKDHRRIAQKTKSPQRSGEYVFMLVFVLVLFVCVVQCQ